MATWASRQLPRVAKRSAQQLMWGRLRWDRACTIIVLWRRHLARSPPGQHHAQQADQQLLFIHFSQLLVGVGVGVGVGEERMGVVECVVGLLLVMATTSAPAVLSG